MKCQAQALGESFGLSGVGLGAQGHQLLAAVTSQDVRYANRAQPLGNGLEHLIADDMSVGIVDPLEVIDVEHDHRDRSGMTFGTVKLDLCQLGKATAIE